MIISGAREAAGEKSHCFPNHDPNHNLSKVAVLTSFLPDNCRLGLSARALFTRFEELALCSKRFFQSLRFFHRPHPILLRLLQQAFCASESITVSKPQHSSAHVWTTRAAKRSWNEQERTVKQSLKCVTYDKYVFFILDKYKWYCKPTTKHIPEAECSPADQEPRVRLQLTAGSASSNCKIYLSKF